VSEAGDQEMLGCWASFKQLLIGTGTEGSLTWKRKASRLFLSDSQLVAQQALNLPETLI
jgi:hypothetical protein